MNPATIARGVWPDILPIILLVCSNLFMTLAWYGHLKYKSVALVTVVLVSWGIAFVEYCFAVPANPDRQRGLFARRAEDHPRGDHADRVRGLQRGLFQGAALPDTGRAGFLLITLGAMLVFRGQARTAQCCCEGVVRPPDGCHPRRRQKLDASKEVADRQHHIGDDGDPEAMVGNERNWREFANHR